MTSVASERTIRAVEIRAETCPEHFAGDEAAVAVWRGGRRDALGEGGRDARGHSRGVLFSKVARHEAFPSCKLQQDMKT
jgi:hypothetical protein